MPSFSVAYTALRPTTVDRLPPKKSNLRMNVPPPALLSDYPIKTTCKKFPQKPLIFSPICVILSPLYAGVMELADVLDSKSSGSDTVRVRPPPPAPKKQPAFAGCFFWWRRRQKAALPQEKAPKAEKCGKKYCGFSRSENGGACRRAIRRTSVSLSRFRPPPPAPKKQPAFAGCFFWWRRRQKAALPQEKAPKAEKCGKKYCGFSRSENGGACRRAIRRTSVSLSRFRPPPPAPKPEKPRNV